MMVGECVHVQVIGEGMTRVSIPTLLLEAELSQLIPLCTSAAKCQLELICVLPMHISEVKGKFKIDILREAQEHYTLKTKFNSRKEAQGETVHVDNFIILEHSLASHLVAKKLSKLN